MKKKFLGTILLSSLMGLALWAYHCSRPFIKSGQLNYTITVPEDAKQVIQTDIIEQKIYLSARRNFDWTQYFMYFFLQKKPRLVSPLAVTFENTPNQVTVGDGTRRYEYILSEGSWKKIEY